MLRVVLDTSTLVSYVLTAGDTMRQIIRAWREGELSLLSSPQTRAELAEVLARPSILERATRPLTPLVEGVARFSIHVPGTLDLSGACRDPQDDKFLACAVEGAAQYLVSFDRDLLEIRQYEGVCILNPGQFLVAWHLARLSPDAIQAHYSLETLRKLDAELCLDPSTKNKLVQVIARSKNVS